MKCGLCETDQPEKAFYDDGTFICRDCVAKLSKLYDVEYAPPVKQSKLKAYLSLILAIRNQAITDHRLADFEDYWLRSSPWNQILGTVYAEVTRHRDMELHQGSMLY